MLVRVTKKESSDHVWVNKRSVASITYNTYYPNPTVYIYLNGEHVSTQASNVDDSFWKEFGIEKP